MGYPLTLAPWNTQLPRKQVGVGRCQNIQYYKSPDELVERLYLLIESKQGGKVSVNTDNEIVAILDRLYQDGIIKKKDYQKL